MGFWTLMFGTLGGGEPVVSNGNSMYYLYHIARMN